MPREREYFKKEKRTCENCSGLGIVTLGSCGKCWGTGKETVWNTNIVIDKDGNEKHIEDNDEN